MVGSQKSRIETLGDQSFSFGSTELLRDDHAIIGVAAGIHGEQQRLVSGEKNRRDMPQLTFVRLQLRDRLRRAAIFADAQNRGVAARASNRCCDPSPRPRPARR